MLSSHHDIFISYRYNDNRSGWVTTFVEAFKEELASTIKDPVSVYFDINAQDGLLDNHHVERSLGDKLKCLIFIPILSQTYCDPRSYAWQKEFCAFNKWIDQSESGRHVTLNNGNVVSRIVPVRIHDLEPGDLKLFENETGEPLRSIDFIYRSAGVNRALRDNEDHPHDNLNNTIYRDQINKLANAIKDIIVSAKVLETAGVQPDHQSIVGNSGVDPFLNTRDSRNELSMDERLLQNLYKAVEANLGNELFSVEDLADEVAYSRSYLHRKLQRLRGVSISQFIRGIRLQHGYELLKKEVGTVSEIAYRVGFNSNTYFTKCFREHFGFSPGEVKTRGANVNNTIAHAADVAADTAVAVKPISPSPLEALHPAASETLIREIFDALVRHKPELEKFLLVNEEEGESVDSRLLAYQIIKSYPYPIGIELRRLFSGNLLARDQERYKQLLQAIDRCVKLLTFILTCELTDQLHAGELTLHPEKAAEIDLAFQELTIDNLTRIIKVTSEQMRRSGSEFFVEELAGVFDTSFSRELEEVVNLINTKDGDYATFDEKYAGLEQALILILKKLSFLAKYRLVNVDAIEVNKPKYKDASFEHRLHILNSADVEFKAHKELMNEFSDSRSVLLMKSIKEPKHFLNLSPFVIDTHAESVNTKEKSNLKRDIYLLSGYDNSKLHYTGVDSCTEDDLSFLENYDALVEEYKDLFKLIGRQ